MTAHLASLRRLEQNVLSELRFLTEGCDGKACVVCDAVARIREHLDADIREVRADVELIFERNGEPW